MNSFHSLGSRRHARFEVILGFPAAFIVQVVHGEVEVEMRLPAVYPDSISHLSSRG